MKYETTNAVVFVLSLCIAILGIGGWISNIVKLIGSDFVPLTGMLVARVIGVFVAPLGAILGFL